MTSIVSGIIVRFISGVGFGVGVGAVVMVGVEVGIGTAVKDGIGVVIGEVRVYARALLISNDFLLATKRVAGINKITKSVKMDLMLKCMIVLLLFFLPLFFIPQAYNKYELSKVLLFRAYIDLLFLILIFGSIAHKRPIVKWGRVGVGVGLFLGVSYLASVIGVDFGQSVLGTYFRNQGMITMLHYVMFFIVLSSLERADFEAILNGLLGGGIIVAGLVLGQFLLNTFGIMEVDLFNGRSHLTFGNPNFLGAYLAICMPIGVWKLVNVRATTRVAPTIWLIAVILMIIGIILSGSRGAILGAGVGMGMLVLSHLKSLGYLSKNGRLKMGSVGLIVAIIAVTFFYVNSRASLYEDRGTIWGAGVRAFVQRPVLGWGVENFEYAYKAVVKEPWLLTVKVDKAHNELIEVAVGSGVVGLAAYIFLIVIIFKNLNLLGRVVLASFIVLSLTNVLSVTAYVVFWILAGMAAVNEENRKEFRVNRVVLVLMAIVCVYLLMFSIENVRHDIMLRNALGDIFTYLSTS